MLLHLRGKSFVYAGMKLVPGNAHEAPVLYELVEKFFQRQGKGVMKRLILDRGFIDGKNISRCKTEWGVDVLIPMKKKMDIWADAWALGGRADWQTLAKLKAQEPPPDPAKVVRHPWFQQLVRVQGADQCRPES